MGTNKSFYAFLIVILAMTTFSLMAQRYVPGELLIKFLFEYKTEVIL